MLVHWGQLQVLYLEEDLDNESLHDAVVNCLYILLKLRLIVFAVNVTSYLVGGVFVIASLKSADATFGRLLSRE